MNLRKNLLPLLALCAAMIAAPSAALAKGNSSHLWDKRGDKATAWADSVYNTLSERQRVAQLIFPKIVPTQGASSKTTIKTLIGKDGFGGILFTKGSLAQYAEMTNYAQSVAKVPPRTHRAPVCGFCVLLRCSDIWFSARQRQGPHR